MASMNIIRSYLFVPASKPERIEKALNAGAGAVIVDLEDAVSPSEKDQARETLRRHLQPERGVYVRINSEDTPWFERDLQLCKSPGITGVLLPKAENPRVIETVAAAIGSGKVLVPLIETARGIDNARKMASTGKIQRFGFGSIDFQVDLRIDGEGEELLFFRSQIVLVSRLENLAPPVDGVTVVFDDEEVVRAETVRGRKLGFGGKLCIHPKQVSVVNGCYRPSAELVDWARKVVDAAKKSNGAAVAVDGKMVDLPVMLRAREILSSI
ncbi:MAG: CoA ester lyase [Burkholderiales bacterium]|nr:CoA ester lyase [Burkholderiales bacterium]